MTPLQPHERYDRIARTYDRWDTRGDKRRRAMAAELLQVRAGDVVLLPGCGTGLDFLPLAAAAGEAGLIIGLDYSKGMLERARKRVEADGLMNVTLIHEDARSLSPELIEHHAHGRAVDALLFSGVLSIVPEWESVFDKAFSLLRTGGRCVIVDVKPATGIARVIGPLLATLWRLGAADVRRPVASLLTGRVDHLDVVSTRTRVIAAGTKR